MKSWKKKNSNLTHFPYGAPPGGWPSPQLPRAGMMHLHGPRRLSSHLQCDCSLSPKASVPACPNTTLASRQSLISPALSGLGISSTQDVSTSPVRTLLTEGLKLSLHIVTKCVISKVTAMHRVPILQLQTWVPSLDPTTWQVLWIQFLKINPVIILWIANCLVGHCHLRQNTEDQN